MEIDQEAANAAQVSTMKDLQIRSRSLFSPPKGLVTIAVEYIIYIQTNNRVGQSHRPNEA